MPRRLNKLKTVFGWWLIFNKMLMKDVVSVMKGTFLTIILLVTQKHVYHHTLPRILYNQAYLISSPTAYITVD